MYLLSKLSCPTSIQWSPEYGWTNWILCILGSLFNPVLDFWGYPRIHLRCWWWWTPDAITTHSHNCKPEKSETFFSQRQVWIVEEMWYGNLPFSSTFKAPPESPWRVPESMCPMPLVHRASGLRKKCGYQNFFVIFFHYPFCCLVIDLQIDSNIGIGLWIRYE